MRSTVINNTERVLEWRNGNHEDRNSKKPSQQSSALCAVTETQNTKAKAFGVVWPKICSSPNGDVQATSFSSMAQERNTGNK